MPAGGRPIAPTPGIKRRVGWSARTTSPRPPSTSSRCFSRAPMTRGASTASCAWLGRSASTPCGCSCTTSCGPRTAKASTPSRAVRRHRREPRHQTAVRALRLLLGPAPQAGPQRAPTPGVHNSGWVQSPGADHLDDPRYAHVLHDYVTGVMSQFRNDNRVLGWDLWNEPDNPAQRVSQGGAQGQAGRSSRRCCRRCSSGRGRSIPFNR